MCSKAKRVGGWCLFGNVRSLDRMGKGRSKLNQDELKQRNAARRHLQCGEGLGRNSLASESRSRFFDKENHPDDVFFSLVNSSKIG